MKMRKVWLVIAMLLFSRTVFAACTGSSPTWTASADQASVQSCIDSASSGDTVNVSAGTETWTTAVTISGKALTLTGAGIGNTNITDGVSGAAALGATGSATNFVTISGFTFIKSADYTWGMIALAGTANEPSYRFHHNRIQMDSSGTNALVAHRNGLIDHNTFDRGSSAGNPMIWAFGDQATAGYTKWQEALSLGTNNALYIEDNTFTSAISAFFDDIIDAYDGAKVVIRFNTFTGTAAPGFHGTDSGFHRSPVSIELYGNNSTNNVATVRGFTHRGGTGMFFNNTYSGSAGWYAYAAQVFRAIQASPGYSWSYCDGTNYDLLSSDYSSGDARTSTTADTAYRFNTTDKETLGTGGSYTRYLDGAGSHGYPCRDQIGIGPGQVLTPSYAWGDSGGVAYGCLDNESDRPSGNPFPAVPYSTWCLENREFYNYTASFDGSVGVGSGLRASRPAAGSSTNGVAYWSTDQGGNWNQSSGGSNDGCLDLMVGGSWVDCYYTPYTYPDPLQGESPPSGSGRVMLR